MEKGKLKTLVLRYLREEQMLGKEFLFFNRENIDLPDDFKELQLQCESCKRCSLFKTRRNVVFGKGNKNAILMLVGEAPGEKEDIKGEPFVGAAGELLTKMLKAINLTRDDVYIANVLKCRPPQNRDPTPEEIEACKGYLFKQIEIINPKIILALGRHAIKFLTDYSGPLSAIRGNVFYYKGIKVIPTYHPAALIYHQEWKRGSWEDLKLARRLYDEALKPQMNTD